jgi:Inositol 1,3,4-trisphosphate 5/6-kinase ATP-grasp domain
MLFMAYNSYLSKVLKRCATFLFTVIEPCNRRSTLAVLQRAYDTHGGAASGVPRCPNYIVVEVGTAASDIGRLIREAGLRYPLICKPIQACGTHGSHSMLVVMDEGSLGKITVPIVVQVSVYVVIQSLALSLDVCPSSSRALPQTSSA